MSDVADLELLIASRVCLVAIPTADIDQVEALVAEVARRQRRRAEVWSISRGLVPLGDPAAPKRRQLAEARDVLAHIATLNHSGLYLMLDLHSRLEDPEIISLLRAVCRQTPDAHPVLVIAGPSVSIPPELQPFSAAIELALPDAQQLAELVDREARDWERESGRRLQRDPETVAALVRNLAGLSLAEARRLLRTAICDDGLLDAADLPRLMAEKCRLLNRDGVLSLELDTARFDQVAGLRRVKRWLAQRQSVFLAAEPPPGLEPPKGLLLLGVQGGGKSLAAKAVAGAWQLPLLRLDFGTLYNKYYGETERNLREALKTATQLAPCVLWIDEIEKGISPGRQADDGPGRRVLGTLLTWMAERREPVFLVATANDIESLPPELLRKGRFDEIFFVDLPSAAVRAEIFRIHLKRRGQDPAGFDHEALAAACEGFTGAEIEQAVISALYAAHASGQALRDAQILAEISLTRPLSVTMAEPMAALRRWAADRTVPAD